MIKHIVLMKWKAGTEATAIEAIEDGFSALVESLDSIHSYEYGSDKGLHSNDYDYALVAEFETEADFKAYVVDEQHQLLMKERIAPVMDSYTTLQFDC